MKAMVACVGTMVRFLGMIACGVLLLGGCSPRFIMKIDGNEYSCVRVTDVDPMDDRLMAKPTRLFRMVGEPQTTHYYLVAPLNSESRDSHPTYYMVRDGKIVGEGKVLLRQAWEGKGLYGITSDVLMRVDDCVCVNKRDVLY